MTQWGPVRRSRCRTCLGLLHEAVMGLNVVFVLHTPIIEPILIVG